MSSHPDFEELSEYVDGGLRAAERSRIETHLGRCADCSAAADRLRRLVTAARSLPREMSPPPEVWREVRHRLPVRARRGVLYAALAAAVVVVAVGGALLGAGRSGREIPPGNAIAVPVALAAVDLSYQASIAELRATLEQQRGVLSPATVRALEHSLAVIDSAIAEARAALAADPANQALPGILSAQYEQKVDLMRRAARLSPAT